MSDEEEILEYRTPVDGNGRVYEGYKISISKDGPVLISPTGHKCSIFDGEDGYNYCQMKYKENDVCIKIKISRLVLSTYQGLPPTVNHTCDHINRQKKDDRLENLRWATKSEQTKNRSKYTFVSTSKKIRVGYLEGELWKQLYDTKSYFSSFGREAIRKKDDNLYLVEHRPRPSGNILFVHPITKKQTGIHIIVSILFLYPDLPNHPMITVTRKKGKQNSNNVDDLILIDKTKSITYDFRTKRGVAYRDLSEEELFKKTVFGGSWLKNATDEQLKDCGITKYNNSIIKTTLITEDSFQIKKPADKITNSKKEIIYNFKTDDKFYQDLTVEDLSKKAMLSVKWIKSANQEALDFFGIFHCHPSTDAISNKKQKLTLHDYFK